MENETIRYYTAIDSIELLKAKGVSFKEAVQQVSRETHFQIARLLWEYDMTEADLNTNGEASHV
jgi:hypothetical protein